MLVDPIPEEMLRRLYRARATTYEMLRDRGYKVATQPASEAEFARRLLAQRKEDVFGALSIRGEGRVPCQVFFSYMDKVGIGVVRDVVALCQKKEVTHAIIVHASTITPFAKTKLANMISDAEVTVTHVETFTFDQLQFNPTRHIDVPPHILLTREEAAKLLERPGVRRETLPHILASDAISRYYGAHRGQIFRIQRKNPEGVVVEVFRVVTPG